jgi:hypothetical protein
MGSDGANYFKSQSPEEDSPIKIDEETSKRYYQLDKLFYSFFPSDILSLGKDRSRAEREAKHIKDSSFTYGEIVSHFYIIVISNIILDLQVNGLHIRIHKKKFS